MFGSGLGRTVADALDRWSPVDPTDADRDRGPELRAFLDRKLRTDRGVVASALGVGGGGHVVRAGGPGVSPTAVVDDQVAVDTVWEVTETDARRLGDAFRRYDGDFDAVVLVAFGVADERPWRRLRLKYDDSGRDGGTAFHFVTKRRADGGDGAAPDLDPDAA